MLCSIVANFETHPLDTIFEILIIMPELKNDYQFKDLSKSLDTYHPISQKALILCRFGLAFCRSVRLPASFFDDHSHRLHGGVLEIWHD